MKRFVLPDIYANPWRYSLKHFVLAAMLASIWWLFVIGNLPTGPYGDINVAALLAAFVLATFLTLMPALASGICSLAGLIIGTFHAIVTRRSRKASAARTREGKTQ